MRYGRAGTTSLGARNGLYRTEPASKSSRLETLAVVETTILSPSAPSDSILNSTLVFGAPGDHLSL